MMDMLDQVLLERVQADFPLTPRPFATLGESLGLSEGQVLERLRRLKGAGLIRQIGAIFDTRRLGYQSTLVAFHVDDGTLEEAAAMVSAHPGVSHNYARPHHYNLWFTLAAPPGRDLQAEIEGLATRSGVDDWLDLPALRVFKLRTHFRLRPGEGAEPQPPKDPERAAPRPLKIDEIPLVRVLQEDLPLIPRPFAGAAERLGLDEKALLAQAGELQAAGIMRRFGAVLRHRRAGYTANGMACWVAPEAQIEAAGQLAATFPQVSHCYQRPAYPPRWPYILFTMIHGQTKDEVEAIVAHIAQETGIRDYEVLYSTREFKKERVKYFEEAT